MKVNLAISGRFHYHKWIRHLDQLGHLQYFYYSHRLSGLGPDIAHRCRNKWLKEHLVIGHYRMMGERLLDLFYPVYHRLWERAVIRDWVKPDVAHILMHGAAVNLMNRCRQDGTLIVGEAVNAHIGFVGRFLSDEYAKIGFKFKRFDTMWDRMTLEYALCDRILVASKWVERSFLEMGTSPEKIIRVPYPSGGMSDSTQRRARRGLGKTVRVLCVAGVQIRKGQHYLLDAIKVLDAQNPGVRFEVTLVGGIADMQYFRFLRAIKNDFNYIRHIDNRDMVDFMANHDVFVLPSLEDGFSVVVTEALQAGLPVVTTTNNGAADAIQDGINGIVVPSADVNALAEGITSALDITMPAAELPGDQVPDWGVYAERMIELYAFLTNNKPRMAA